MMAGGGEILYYYGSIKIIHVIFAIVPTTKSVYFRMIANIFHNVRKAFEAKRVLSVCNGYSVAACYRLQSFRIYRKTFFVVNRYCCECD